jgi:hypothetical protein
MHFGTKPGVKFISYFGLFIVFIIFVYFIKILNCVLLIIYHIYWKKKGMNDILYRYNKICHYVLS